MERLVPRLPDAFAADVLLRMAAFAPKAGKRREWLEESFRHARRVEHPPVAVKYFGTGGDHYHAKMVLYQALMRDMPVGPYREQAAREWGEFFDGSYDRMESKAEWAYYLLTHLLGRASESAQGAAVREVAARSHNPVLLAYVLLWRLKAGDGA